jgi:hypothetical protein
MVLDDDLDFMLPPVEFKGETGSLQSAAIVNDTGEVMILSCYNYAGNMDIPDKLVLTRLDGDRVMEKTFSHGDTLSHLFFFPFQVDLEQLVYCIIRSQGIFTIDASLEFNQLSGLPLYGYASAYIDLNDNDIMEIMISNHTMEQYMLFMEEWSHPVTLNIPRPTYELICSVKRCGDASPQLAVQSDDSYYLFDIGQNPVYRLRVLLYLGIFLATLGFILFIRFLYSLQVLRRYETEKKLTAFHLNSIQSQMDPHFIYNVMNTIGSSIYKEDRDKAYKNVVNFSNMVRTMLTSSDHLSLTLNKELEFTRSYLELQKSRFPDLFDYRIEVSDQVDTEAEIPKMIIQTHTENAVRHGLIPKKKQGMLNIAIFIEDGYIIIRLEDNGIGRARSRELQSTSTGKGLQIMKQFFEIYNRYNSPPLRQEVTDLFDENNDPAGTRVVISVPLNFNAKVINP